MIKRRKTRTVKIDSVKIGFNFPIAIQSMSKTDTKDVHSTIKEINALAEAGCEIVRVAVKDMRCAKILNEIRTKINIPLVADIHFNYRLALEAIAQGVDGLRLNPGNIYRREEIKEIAKAAKKRHIPIRVGINAGSLLKKPARPGTAKRAGETGPECKRRARNQKPDRLADLMVKTAQDYIQILESYHFYDIIVSLKAADVQTTVNAYRKMASLCNYPFHLGVTACGLSEEGIVKSAAGIGCLLLEGIGDTIRVSLTDRPEKEIKTAEQILQSLGLRYFKPEIISCPTCGRCSVDLISITNKVKNKIQTLNIKHKTLNKRPLKIAIMGCEVNGPGEARQANLGIACGKNSAVLFKKGKIIKKVKENRIVDTLVTELTRLHRR